MLCIFLLSSIFCAIYQYETGNILKMSLFADEKDLNLIQDCLNNNGKREILLVKKDKNIRAVKKTESGEYFLNQNAVILGSIDCEDDKFIYI